MPAFSMLSALKARAGTLRWPFRWVAHEPPQVGAAYRALLEFNWLVCLPAQLLTAITLVGFSHLHLPDESFMLRFALGALLFAVAFLMLPALGLLRCAAALRNAGNSSLRVRSFGACAAAIGFLAAGAGLALIGVVVYGSIRG